MGSRSNYLEDIPTQFNETCPSHQINDMVLRVRRGGPLPVSSWWMRSAKLGSSPHQKSQSSLRPCRWLRRHTLSTSALRQRLKLHRMGSSSVTGKTMGAEVGPCHTNLFHLIPVKSACRTGGERSLGVTASGSTQHLEKEHVLSRV